ncbi:MAG: tetratricopeptide repeat protein [Hyphomicrobiales bacterium]|nr:tetratricopeptide repeat protein [Hyphomicrobiales bacterium]
MANWPEPARASHHLIWKLMTTTAIICVAAACTPLGKKQAGKNHIPAPNFSQKTPKQALKPNNPLHIATTYWAGEYQKNPSNPKAALAYAKNLKAIGAKDRAITILAQAHQQHPSNTEIASNYGRLLLEKGKSKLALRALKKAEKPRGKTDWRVLSALGTAHAKLGEHKLAQQYFTAALRKKPNTPSLLNNLALSYAMSGDAEKAEPLLRRAIKSGHDTPRVRQNLALVLGLQNKFSEAKQIASVDLSNDRAEANIAYLRSMVPNRTVAAATPKNQQFSQLAMKATPEKPEALPRKKKKAATAKPAVRAAQSAHAKQANDRQVSSQTMPLPWAKPSPQPRGAAVRTALAKPVPLPTPKPSRPTTRTPAPAATTKTGSRSDGNARSAAASKHSPPKSQNADSRSPDWQTKVAKADHGKSTQSILYPNMD